jgi:hypothetical protein
VSKACRVRLADFLDHESVFASPPCIFWSGPDYELFRVKARLVLPTAISYFF